MKRALISVSDKRGILEFAKGLAGLKIEILSTGGTAKLLKENKIPVIEVGDYTGQPEILDGRLKTLHPKIHGGILAVRSNPKHMKEIKESGIEPIDLLVVNLYPFEETIAKEGVSLEVAIENIDIGGPTMIRAAAKNWQDVTVVVDPEDYPPVLEELRKGGVSQETNFRLAKKVFVLTARYDGAIANYLTGGRDGKYPEAFNYQGIKSQDLRYGENPHQTAAFYRDVPVALEPSVSTAVQRHGKELSYNNIMDLDAAIEAVKEFRERAVVIIKHATPCGVAVGSSLQEIFIAARDCDPLSAFGGIIAVNDRIDVPTAEAIGKDFYECVISAGYDDEAFRILAAKKNIRLMEISAWDRSKEWSGSKTFRKVTGGLLVQDRDLKQFPVREARVVTKRKPSEEEWRALEFAWKVVKHVKSNAIVYAAADRTIGIGGGQVSRVDSTKIAISKARSSLRLTPAGFPPPPASGGYPVSVMASDAFFPFRDNVDEAAKAGITAIVQPGGSLRDAEVIQAADLHGIAMVFTGVRHFRH